MQLIFLVHTGVTTANSWQVNCSLGKSCLDKIAVFESYPRTALEGEGSCASAWPRATEPPGPAGLTALTEDCILNQSQLIPNLCLCFSPFTQNSNLSLLHLKVSLAFLSILLTELDLHWNIRPSIEESRSYYLLLNSLFLVICKTSAWKNYIYSRDLLDDALKLACGFKLQF